MASKRKLTLDDLRKLTRAQFEKEYRGSSYVKVGKKYNCTGTSVKKLCAKHQIKPNPKGAPSQYKVPTDKQYERRYRKNGFNNALTCREFGITIPAGMKIRDRLGMPVPHKTHL